jgi:hypothetical protein
LTARAEHQGRQDNYPVKVERGEVVISRALAEMKAAAGLWISAEGGDLYHPLHACLRASGE